MTRRWDACHSARPNLDAESASRPHWSETHGISVRFAVSVSALLHFDFDRFWFLRHGAFWQMNAQHAIFEVRRDLRGVGIIRDGKGAQEAPKGSFDPMEFCVLLFPLNFSLARDC